WRPGRLQRITDRTRSPRRSDHLPTGATVAWRHGNVTRGAYGQSMRIGAHVDSADPIAEAANRGADVVQFFLTDPQGYETPKPRPDADRLRTADVDVYIHAPYLINVATPNNRIRIPTRKLLAAH